MGVLERWQPISGMGTSVGKYNDPHTLDGLAAFARFTETSPGLFTIEPWPVLLCNEPTTRAIYAPIAAPPEQPVLRANTDACVRRSMAVVPDIHRTWAGWRGDRDDVVRQSDRI